MAKIVKNVLKKVGHAYKEGLIQLYGPCIKYNVPINI